ncbi:MAG TPA: hypothetical protein VE817_08390, partial [Candidatus Acidoferrum sp.]|nr:hypothetical protein [Candidatus Acidoferrum sp.]
TAGDWPVPAVVRLSIPGGSGALRKVVIGPRLDGRPHDPESIVDLEGVAGLASAAVRAVRMPAP